MCILVGSASATNALSPSYPTIIPIAINAAVVSPVLQGQPRLDHFAAAVFVVHSVYL